MEELKRDQCLISVMPTLAKTLRLVYQWCDCWQQLLSGLECQNVWSICESRSDTKGRREKEQFSRAFPQPLDLFEAFFGQGNILMAGRSEATPDSVGKIHRRFATYFETRISRQKWALLFLAAIDLYTFIHTWYVYSSYLWLFTHQTNNAYV